MPRRMLLAVVAATGCGGSGSVSLRFDVAEEQALRPSGAATLTLIARVGEDAPRATTAEIGDGSAIDLGSLPVDDDIWLTAELRTGEEHLVGYGESAGPLTVSATSLTEATIPVRRPFVYLAGTNQRLVTLDASVASTASYQGSVNTPGSAAVVAAVAGTDVATITSTGALAYVSTSTHMASELPGAQLAGMPNDAVATPDGAFLVVGHAGNTVSVVDVASGDVTTASVGGSADRVTVALDADGVWRGIALIGRAIADTGCAPSRLVIFPLTDPSNTTTIEAGLGLADVTTDLQSGDVLVADRCGDRVLRLDPAAGELQAAAPIMTIAAPTTLAAYDGQVYVIGHDRQTTTDPNVPDGILDAWLILGSADLVTKEAIVDALPVLIERVVAQDGDFPDQDITQDLHANSTEAIDVTVMPGGEQLAFTMTAVMHGDEITDDVFGSTLIPEITMTTREYWLIDAATTATSQRVRTRCDLVVPDCGGCFLAEWSCLPDLDDVPGLAFTPTGVTALFGVR